MEGGPRYQVISYLNEDKAFVICSYFQRLTLLLDRKNHGDKEKTDKDRISVTA